MDNFSHASLPADREMEPNDLYMGNLRPGLSLVETSSDLAVAQGGISICPSQKHLWLVGFCILGNWT